MPDFVADTPLSGYFHVRRYLPMAKNKTRIDVITVFDGELDATDVSARNPARIILRKHKIYAILKTRFR